MTGKVMTLRFLFPNCQDNCNLYLVPKLLVLDAMRLPEHGDTRPQHCHSKHRFAVLNDKSFEDVVHLACDLHEPEGSVFVVNDFILELIVLLASFWNPFDENVVHPPRCCEPPLPSSPFSLYLNF